MSRRSAMIALAGMLCAFIAVTNSDDTFQWIGKYGWAAFSVALLAMAGFVGWAVVERGQRKVALAALGADRLARNRPRVAGDLQADLSLQRYVVGARRRWVASRVYLALIVLVLPITSISAPLIALSAGSNSYLGWSWIYPIAGYFAGFVLPVLLSLPVLLPSAVHWRNPRRIVVFRRFHIAENMALGRALTRYLARYGHVFTLADRRLHLHWTVRIPLLLGQLSLLHFRPRRIDNDGRLEALSRLLAQRVRLNVNWMVSYGKLFALRTSDEFWRASVRLMLDHADLAVIDLSESSESLLWEIDECLKSLPGRTIFLAGHEKYGPAVEWIEGIAATRPDLDNSPLFAHRKGRILEEESFRLSIAERLHQAGRASAPMSRHTWASFASAKSMSLVVSVLTLVLIAPFYFPGFTARISPLQWQLEEVYFGGSSSAQAALLRLDRIGHDAAIIKMIGLARRNSFKIDLPTAQDLAAVAALGRIGDRRAIGPLMELAGSPQERIREQAAVGLQQLSLRLRGEFIPESLSVLRSRHPELDGRVAVPMSNLLRQVSSRDFVDLLQASPRAARFTAALRLAPEMDSRTVPVLLEMMRWTTKEVEGQWVRVVEIQTRPLEQPAHTLLEGIGRHSGARVEPAWLEPYLRGSDQAALDAVRLAFPQRMDRELAAALSSAAGGEGTAIISQMAEVGKNRGQADAIRAATILRAAAPSILNGMLKEGGQSAAQAIVALGVRGDPATIRPAIELARIKHTEWIVYTVHDYESLATAALDYLSEHPLSAAAIPAPFTDLEGVPLRTLGALVRVLAKSGNDAPIRSVVEAVTRHSDAGHWYSDEESFVAAAIPPRIDQWLLDRALAEPDRAKQKILDTLFREAMRSQRPGCDAFGDLSEVAKVCHAPK
jgi:hypothetical protein